MRIKTTFVAFRHLLSYSLIAFLIYHLIYLDNIFTLFLYGCMCLGLMFIDQVSLQAVYSAAKIPFWPARRSVNTAQGAPPPFRRQSPPG